MAKVEKDQGQDTRLPLWAQNKERRRAKQEERSRILQWKAEIDHAMRMDEERAERRARALAREAAERKEARASRTFERRASDEPQQSTPVGPEGLHRALPSGLLKASVRWAKKVGDMKLAAALVAGGAEGAEKGGGHPFQRCLPKRRR